MSSEIPLKREHVYPVLYFICLIVIWCAMRRLGDDLEGSSLAGGLIAVGVVFILIGPVAVIGLGRAVKTLRRDSAESRRGFDVIHNNRSVL